MNKKEAAATERRLFESLETHCRQIKELAEQKRDIASEHKASIDKTEGEIGRLLLDLQDAESGEADADPEVLRVELEKGVRLRQAQLADKAREVAGVQKKLKLTTKHQNEVLLALSDLRAGKLETLPIFLDEDDGEDEIEEP